MHLDIRVDASDLLLREQAASFTGAVIFSLYIRPQAALPMLGDPAFFGVPDPELTAEQLQDGDEGGSPHRARPSYDRRRCGQLRIVVLDQNHQRGRFSDHSGEVKHQPVLRLVTAADNLVKAFGPIQSRFARYRGDRAQDFPHENPLKIGACRLCCLPARRKATLLAG